MAGHFLGKNSEHQGENFLLSRWTLLVLGPVICLGHQTLSRCDLHPAEQKILEALQVSSRLLFLCLLPRGPNPNRPCSSSLGPH